MGWTPANELWLSVRGGDLLISAETGAASEKFDKAKLGSRGFGILDVGWACLHPCTLQVMSFCSGCFQAGLAGSCLLNA